MNVFRLLKTLLLLFGFFLVSCSAPSEGNAPSTGTSPPIESPVSQLLINPSSLIVAVNNSFNFSASGGTAPYNFAIVSGGGTILTVAQSGQFTAPATPGVSVIQLTDSKGGLISATVTINAELQISPLSQTIVTNSTLRLSASGGVPPYYYSISSGSGTIDPLTGLYTAPAVNTTANIIVTDSIGNTSSSSIAVTSILSINPPSKSLMINDVFTFSGSGGTAPLVYSILSGSGTINSSTGLFTAPSTAGSVTVRVSDSFGATADAVVTINPTLSISPAAITVSANGSLTFMATGGVAPRTFSILSGAGSINSSTGGYTAPSTAGNTIIRVTDSLGHTADSTVTITNTLGINPAAATLAINNSTTFSAIGGSSPFIFSIVSGGGVINATTGAYTAPSTAGSVTIRVTDNLGANADANVTVNAGLTISPNSITKSINSTHTFSATGGVTPYTYSITNGGGSIDSITGLFTAPSTAGSVAIRVTDALSNISNASVTIVNAPTISPTSKTLAVNNTFTFSSSGGLTPYTYSIVSGGGTINSSSGLFTAPSTAGSVTIRVTDSLNQTAQSVITVNPALTIAPSSITKSVNSNQSFSATGGAFPYTYSILSGGGTIDSSTGLFTAPSTAGSVTVRVTDSLSNTSNATVTIVNTPTITPATKTLAVNSTFIFSATGGLSPYTYSIVSGGGTIDSSTGLFTAPSTSGSVTVRVTDALSNVSNASVTIMSAPVISPSTKTLAVNNTFTFTTTGGLTPYTYSIVNGGGTIDSATGQFTAPSTSGSVTVRVTDSLNQTSDSVVTVNPALVISPSSLTKSVNSSQTFSATGGLTPYTYSIVSGGGTIDSSTGLFTAPSTSGSVTVRVTDALSNVSNASVTIMSAPVISPATKTLAVNNTFTFTTTGGLTPYTYSIVNGGGTIDSATGQFTAPSTSGSATVRVTDSLNQTSDSVVTVNPALVISPSSITKSVNSTQTFSATGGLTPYTYSIVSGGGTIDSSTGLFTAPSTSGSVTVRVTDALSNVSNAPVTIMSAPVISPATKTLAVNNTFTFTTTGGLTPYTYSIVSGGGTIDSSTGLFTAPSTSGSVTVRVTDSLGAASDSILTVNAALLIGSDKNGVNINGTITFSASGGVAPFTYSIVSGGGAINSTTGVFTAPNSSSTTVVKVTDSLSNTSSKTVYISAPPTISNISSFDIPQGVTVSVGFTINDDLTALSCNNTYLSATSSNTSVLSLSNITFSGTAPNCFASFYIAAGSGSSNVTISVTDLSQSTTTASFTATVFQKPAMAFSFRKVIKDWTGQALRIRRSTDNMEQDIGFLTNGDFDTAAYNSFVGTGIGYIRTWYDQSGNNYHANQTATASQPQVNINGFNGKPMVEFGGTSWLVTTTAQNVITAARDLTVFFTAKATTAGQNNFGSWNPSNSADRISIHLNWSNNYIYWDAPAICCSSARLSVDNSANVGLPKAYVFGRNNTYQYITINGTIAASSNTATGTYGSPTEPWYLGSTGAYGSGTAPVAEYMQFTIGLTDNQVLNISNEQKNYFGL